MKILFRLLVFFLTMPVVELALLMQLDHWIGFWWTVAIIAATAVTGSYLAKREGLSAWNRLQKRLGKGELPGKELLDAVIILIAGALLITPGVITDLVGFIGLIPLTRGWVRTLVMKRLKKAAREGRIETSFGAFGGAAWPPAGNAPDEKPHEEEAGDGSPPPKVGGTPSPHGPAPDSSTPESRNGARAPEQRSESPSGASALGPENGGDTRP